MKCSACQSENDASQNFCYSCGTTLGGAQVAGGRRATPLEEAPLPPKQAYVPPTAPRRTVREDDDEPVRPPAPGARAGYVPPQQPAQPHAAPPAAPPPPPQAPQSAASQPRVGTAPGVPVRRADRTRLDDDDDGSAAVAAPGQRPQGAPEGGRQIGRIVGWMVSFDINDTGQDHLIREGRNLIGRGPSSDIQLFYDNTVSDRHAAIVYRGGRVAIKDETSTTGTFVNGEDIGMGESHALHSGDVLKIGKSSFKVFILDLEETRQIWPKIGAK